LALLKGLPAVAKLLLNNRSAIVWGFGGRMTALPLVLARILGMVCGIHQSDRVLGRANRILARIVPHVVLGYPDTHKVPKSCHHLVLGTPVREEFHNIPPLQIKADKILTIAILGGSQGSRFWQTLMPQAVSLLSLEERQRLCLIHQSAQDVVYPDGVMTEITPFIHDMAHLFTRSHVIFTRAGASSVAEIMVAGRPALFVPYPHATDEHQWWNAKGIVDQRGGWMEQESQLTPEKVAELLKNFLYNPDQVLYTGQCIRGLAKPEAAQDLCALFRKLLGKV
jgi:UDP-N-acetylglucosamine--N-acetylmuramyl-(pentapeptide) pyrophosphoryl-undecaprenol N-acetylglucosamine transferase